MSKKERREMLDGFKCSATIFLAFCLWMTLSSFTFRPQVDVLAAYMEPVMETRGTGDPSPTEPERDTRAEEMAKVVYGTALYNSEEAQRAVMWCILNRCESGLYPNTVEEVCSQSSQWMGYSSDNPVVDRLYDMACDVLSAWELGGERNLPKDCLWFDWSGTESITFRTGFDGRYNTWTVE